MEKETKKAELQDKDLEQVSGGFHVTATTDIFDDSEPSSPGEHHFNLVKDLIFEHYRKMKSEGTSHESFIIWAKMYVESDYQNGNLTKGQYDQLMTIISTM